jgi:hypothetical protein
VTLPDWPTLREHMLAPKPAIRFTAYAIGRDPLRIRFDGESFVHADTGAPLVGEAWITSAVEPRRFARLLGADGSVTDHESMPRSAFVAEVRGLRGSATMRLWIDREIGCILRMERADDPAPLLVLDDLVLDDQSLADSGKGTRENTRHSTRS